jgi:fatty acid desaturase
MNRQVDSIASGDESTSASGDESAGQPARKRQLTSSETEVVDEGLYIHDKSFDADQFTQDIDEAKQAIGPSGPEDAAHLYYLIGLAQALTYGGHLLVFASAFRVGGATLQVIGGILGAFMISFSRCMRWTIIGHHVSHGGYTHLAGKSVASKYRRGIFGVGFVRRVIDWLDWMLPEAWDLEHNKLHHYELSEDNDPDLVERNFKILRDMPLPNVLKLMSMLFWMATWKWAYYSPNTLKEYLLSKKTHYVARHWPKRISPNEPMTFADVLVRRPIESVLTGNFREIPLWFVVAVEWLLLLAPMILLVVFPPLMLLTLSTTPLWSLLCPSNLEVLDVVGRSLALGLVAEVLTNAHSFFVIAPNHCGKDLYHYQTPCTSYSAEFFLRCIYSSANFETGSDLVDIPYGWLNYQVEHHMFPNMTPMQYRKLQPLIKSICKKHGVTYTQQNGFVRTWAMLRVAVGMDSMKSVVAVLPPACNGNRKAVKANRNDKADKLVGA